MDCIYFNSRVVRIKDVQCTFTDSVVDSRPYRISRSCKLIQIISLRIVDSTSSTIVVLQHVLYTYAITRTFTFTQSV